MRRAVRVQLSDAEARQLRAWAQGSGLPARRPVRARIVLLAAEGRTNKEIARALGVHAETVALWRRRFVSNRLEGVRMDAPRSGHRSRSTRLARLIVDAVRQDESETGKGWTTRRLAKRFGVSHMTVHRAWHAATPTGAHPSAAPHAGVLEGWGEPVEIDGVYLHPPRRAAVFQVDGREVHSGLHEPLGLPPSASMEGENERLSVLFQQWKRSAGQRSGSVRSVAELLVFLRMVERKAGGSGEFVVLYEGFSRAAETRVLRWTRSHPRFQPVRVPAGTNWFKTVERCLVGKAPEPTRAAGKGALRPVAESLATYLRANPSAPAPFVWTAPFLGESPAGPSGAA